MNNLSKQVSAMIKEFIDKTQLVSGSILVVGCSTSEVIGSKIGTNSSPETARILFEQIYEATKEKGIYLAAQCCEHLNRAIVIERETVATSEIVNVVPQPKAGGSFATQAYHSFRNPVVVENIQADAGIDIGSTLIGMHFKKVAVPLRLENNIIGEATVVAARTRPKFIGGIRAAYDDSLL